MPMRSSCSRMYGTCCAASGVLTVMRTSSEPAMASSFTWMAVPIASTVSVFVMDCTRTGASPPTVTTRPPHATFACTERRAAGAAGSIGRQGAVMGNSLDVEAGHVVVRNGPQVERLSAHLHLGLLHAADGDRQRQRAAGAGRFAGAHQAPEHGGAG